MKGQNQSRHQPGRAAVKLLAQVVDGQYREAAEQDGEGSQMKFGKAELSPSAQQEIVEGHVALAPLEKRGEIVPGQARDGGADSFLHPQASGREIVEAEEGRGAENEKKSDDVRRPGGRRRWRLSMGGRGRCGQQCFVQDR